GQMAVPRAMTVAFLGCALAIALLAWMAMTLLTSGSRIAPGEVPAIRTVLGQPPVPAATAAPPAPVPPDHAPPPAPPPPTPPRHPPRRRRGPRPGPQPPPRPRAPPAARAAPRPRRPWRRSSSAAAASKAAPRPCRRLLRPRLRRLFHDLGAALNARGSPARA